MLPNWRMNGDFTRVKHPAFIMKMVSDRADAIFAQRVGTLRVTAPQCRLLMYLESLGGKAVTQRDIEHYLGVSHTTVKGLLQRLEEKGYVRTAFDSRDRRVKHAYLTEEFYRMHAQAREAMRGFEEQLMRGFSAEETEQLRGMLERIYHNTLTTEPPVPSTKHQ
ncbi:MAG: MarR family transcriptional regulator [Akkermansiaceae bacterium]|nr:MarR family transcriptional regulator [Akkermansiaceae bacterium]